MTEMFSEEAWNEGWAAAQVRGRRDVTRKDVEAIVSAVVNHGFEEIYVDQAVANAVLDSMPGDAMERLRDHMRTRLAVEAIRNDCVMLTLPREVTGPSERGLTTMRLIVPVRRLRSGLPHHQHSAERHVGEGPERGDEGVRVQHDKGPSDQG